MKDPAFLFYSQDFLTGTLIMSFEDRGKYITLLSYQHQNGRLSEETIRLLIGSFSDMLRLKFKKDENGLFYNERLEIEIEKRNKFIESRYNNGKLGGRPPKDIKPSAKPNGKPKKKLIENESEDENLLVFDEFRKLYLGNKRGNETEFDNFVKKHDDWKIVLPNLKASIEKQISIRNLKSSRKEFVPEWKNLQTWINQRCWEEEIILPETDKQQSSARSELLKLYGKK